MDIRTPANGNVAPASPTVVIQDNVILTAALDYVARGFKVLPLRPREKVPHGALARHGVKDASNDPVVIRDWWTQCPDANVGIACDNLLVVDVDPRNGGDLSLGKLIGVHGPFNTLTASTPSGGFHYYHDPAAEAPLRSRKSAEFGIDLQGAGSYVVAPPSVGANGIRYAFTNKKPIAPVPAWLGVMAKSSDTSASELTTKQIGDLIAPFDDPEVRARDVEGLLSHIANDDRFEGREAWLRMVYAIGNAISDEGLACGAVVRWSESREDFTEGEAERVFTTRGKAHKPIGYDHLLKLAYSSGYVLRDDHPFHATNEFTADSQAIAPPAPPKMYISLRELLERPELLMPPVAIIPRLAWRGRLTILVGREKEGKSTLAAHACTALSKGARFFGESTRSAAVVWCGLEEALGDAVRRFAELGADHNKVTLVANQSHLVLGGTREILRETGAGLLIIDSLQEYARTIGAPPKDGDNAGWSDVIRPLVKLAHELDVAVLVLHHSRKADGEYRGATEIAAAADVTLTMRAGKSDPAVRSITGRGRWQVEPYDVALRDEQYVLADGSELPLEVLVLDYVEAHPGSSREAVRKGVGKAKPNVKVVIDLLLRANAIEDRSTTNGASLFKRRNGEEFAGAVDLSDLMARSAALNLDMAS